MKIFNNYGIKSRNVILMYLEMIFAGMQFFLPILALYFQKNLFTLTNVALIFSIQSIAIAIFQYPTGALADIIGRKKAMILANISVLIGTIFLAFGHNMTMFVIYALVTGFGNGLWGGSDSALIWDTLKQEKKEKFFKKIIGTKYALWPVGASIGSIVGGYLASYSYSFPIFLTFIPLSLALLTTILMEEPKYKKENHKNIFKLMWRSSGKIITNWQLTILILSAFIFIGIGDAVHSLKPIFLEFWKLPVISLGYFFAASFALSSLGHYFSHDVARILGDKKTIILGSFMLTLSILLATFFSAWFAVFFLLFGQLFYGIGRPVTEHLIHLETTSNMRATVLSAYNLMRFAGIAVFTPLLGWLAGIYDINIGFRISALFMFSIPILFLFLKNRNNKV